MTWIQTHWPLIVALAGAVYSLLSIINGAITNPEAKGIIGKILDGLSYIARGGAPGSVKMPFTLSKKPGLQPPTAGTIIAGQSARMLVPFLFIGAFLSSCALPQPIPTNLDGGTQSYTAAFEACLKNDGISDATNVGAQIFQILDNSGGQSAQQIEAAVEKVLVTVGGTGVILVATCAVDAWDAVHPVLAGAKPNPPQAAIRLFRAEHMVAPTVQH